jgi:hypothetical protein
MPDDPQLAIQRTIQSQVRDDTTRTALVLWLASGTEVLPSWWSKRRDQEMRKFWRSVDMLAGAVYALESKMATIPFHIEPKDYTVRTHLDQADRFNYMLQSASEWGHGWSAFFGKWTQDLITQDNGAFGEIIGDGDPAGPIVGMPYAVCSLDSARCDRTSNPEYPVVYLNLDGKRYKLHYTRVAFASLQPSPIAEMHDVGFCSVSKCVNISQNLLDILVYNQEKLGSRPSRGLMVASGGLDAEDIKAAFKLAGESMDNQMLSRFSKTVVLGDASAPEGKLELHDLASLPDGFDYETSMTLGMAAIALAFGVDARELWPMTSTGSTRADALIQHLKAQTKGIGHLLAIAEQAIFAKILPDTLTAEFDYTDDAADRQVAEIKGIRAERHNIDLTQTKSVDLRTVREQMLSDEDLSQSQFEALELEDGRLDDGSPTLQLFYDPDYAAILNMGIPDPLDTEANDKKLITPIIADKRREIIMALGQLKNVRPRNQLMMALGALKALEEWYGEVKEPVPPAPAPFQGQAANQPEPEASTDEINVDASNETVTEEDLEPIPATEV